MLCDNLIYSIKCLIRVNSNSIHYFPDNRREESCPIARTNHKRTVQAKQKSRKKKERKKEKENYRPIS